MFSLIKQLEDISGAHKLTVTRFAKHDIFMFGNQDLHIFVITSPTSEERVAKSLVDLVGTLSNGAVNLENAITKATAGLLGRKETVSAAISPPNQSVRSEQSQVDRRGMVLHKSRPEAIAMLQGYLLGLEPGCTVEDDIEGRFKIKAIEDDSMLSWSLLEKISSVFKDKIVIHHVGKGTDGKIFVRISTK
jgi:hypothetical protein